MAKYPVDKMRARLGFVVSDREPRILTWESGGCHPASIAECALWDALAERIKADEGAVPCGYLITWNDQSYRGKQSLSFDRCDPDDGAFVPVFAHPPAQAAQVDQVGELLAIIHGDGGHYQAEHGLQKAAKDAQEKVIQMMTKLTAAPQPGEPS